jgi:hypothetical protein
MEIYPNQARMTSFSVIANGTFFLHQAEAVLLKQPHQFTEFHRRQITGAVAGVKGFHILIWPGTTPEPPRSLAVATP